MKEKEDILTYEKERSEFQKEKDTYEKELSFINNQIKIAESEVKNCSNLIKKEKENIAFHKENPIFRSNIEIDLSLKAMKQYQEMLLTFGEYVFSFQKQIEFCLIQLKSIQRAIDLCNMCIEKIK